MLNLAEIVKQTLWKTSVNLSFFCLLQLNSPPPLMTDFTGLQSCDISLLIQVWGGFGYLRNPQNFQIDQLSLWYYIVSISVLLVLSLFWTRNSCPILGSLFVCLFFRWRTLSQVRVSSAPTQTKFLDPSLCEMAL